MNTAERFPASFLWENADKAMAFALGLPAGAARDFFVAIAGRMLDDRYTFAKTLPDPAAQPVPPRALPDMGHLVVGSFAEFDGFGRWTLSASVRVTVRVFEHHGPSGVPRIITDGTRTDGAMLILDPGTYAISTWIVAPEDGAAYGSAIEVQPA